MIASKNFKTGPGGIQKQQKIIPRHRLSVSTTLLESTLAESSTVAPSSSTVRTTVPESHDVNIDHSQCIDHDRGVVDQYIVSQSSTKLDLFGSPDIVKCIMTFVDDKEFLPNFMNYMKAFEDVIQQDCYQALTRRGVLYCTSIDEMKFLSTHLYPNDGEMKGCSQIEIDGHVGEWEDAFSRAVGYFPIVHLNGSSLSCRNLVDLIKWDTFQIQHLMLTNVVMLGDTECLDGSVFELTPSLTRISFDINRSNGQELCNPILRIGDKLNLISSNIQELCFLKPLSQADSRLVDSLSEKITKLSLFYQNVIYDLPPFHFPLLYQYSVDSFPSKYMRVPVLDVRNVSVSTNTGNGNSQVVILRNCEFPVNDGISRFIWHFSRSFETCKELILSESFASILNKNDFTGNEIVSTLDKITIKYSKHSDPYKYGLLKYALRINFPERVEIVLEEIEPLKDKFDFDYFAPISYGPCQLCTEISDCKANEIFKRIEQVSNRFKDSQNEDIRNQLKELKKSFGTNMFNFNEKEWKKNMDNLDMLEGLKSNKRQTLQQFNQAIEKFHDIFLDCDFYTLIMEQYNQTMISLEGELFESRFAQDFSQLEKLIVTMKGLVEENGISSDILFTQGDVKKDEQDYYCMTDEEIESFEVEEVEE